MAIKILIHASPYQHEQWLLKPIANNIELQFYTNEVLEADLYIDNNFNTATNIFRDVTSKPVLINSLPLDNLPTNYFLFNGWATSIKYNTLEVSTTNQIYNEDLKKICEAANWKLFLFNNIIGLPTQRTISMIINEAYFALEANVSSKEDIDIAMKLGTNYPFGPFEWSEKIGLKEIYFLLKTISEYDSKFTPCKLLETEALS